MTLAHAFIHWYDDTHGSHTLIHLLTHTRNSIWIEIILTVVSAFTCFLWYYCYCSVSLPHAFVVYLIVQSMNRSTGFCAHSEIIFIHINILISSAHISRMRVNAFACICFMCARPSVCVYFSLSVRLFC